MAGGRRRRCWICETRTIRDAVKNVPVKRAGRSADIQKTYLSVLEGRGDIAEIRCNVWLEGLEMGDYTSDFVCIKADGDLLVRECVFRKYLTKPKTVKLLDVSRTYWQRRGVQDWGLVIDEEK